MGGLQARPRTCPVCGQPYTHTNFMIRKRRAYNADGRPGGWQRTDTHIMSCLKKRGLDPWTNPRTVGAAS